MSTNSAKSASPEFTVYNPVSFNESEMKTRAVNFRALMERRRSVREFEDEPVPLDVILNAVKTACTAPSGANKQPWHFCIVTNAAIKKEIRIRAEEEELKSYTDRMSDQWLEDLAPLGTDHHKPFLEKAPCLIIIFKKPFDLCDGKKKHNYYVNESVGIATGIFIAALQNAGLATLTHTPSPMNFLAEILNRPENERAYLLMPVGYPKNPLKVPDISRKPTQDVVTEYF